MKLHENCLPCIVRQAVRTAGLVGAPDRESLYRKVFARMAQADFSETAPELCGEIYALIKAQLGAEDPYAEVRKHCNALMMGLLPSLRNELRCCADPFSLAVRYAILGNIIDFSAPGELSEEKILCSFSETHHTMGRDDTELLRADVLRAKSLLYIGDNCGEIVADVLLLEELLRLNPQLRLIYAVRGAAVVNDVIRSDALDCGIDRLAEIIDNGDDSQGTALKRVSEAFRHCYDTADVIIAKGQGNYESLSEEPRPGVYCLLLAKCAHIAASVGVKPGEMAAFRLQ